MNAPRHLVVAGAQRCGTTYVAAQLAAHPQVAMARPARPEPKAFLADEVVERGREWYLRTWFAHAGDELVLGEKSTSYLESAAAPARIRAVLGEEVLVLVQLRDPLARAVSNWRFSAASGLERRPLAQALEENLHGPLPWDPAATSVSPFAYLERGRYAAALRPWLEAFPGRVRVQLLEDLVALPEGIAELYAWLGVDPDFRAPDLGRAVNEAEAPPQPLDDSLPRRLAERLRASFDTDDAVLAELLGRPLPWRAGGPAGGPR